MDAQGMLSQELVCKRCGKKLNADGNHPAERYAGTCTFECDVCANAGPYVLERVVSGAARWSCPPHCPSWRRDREQFYQFEGCSCDHGRTWESSFVGWGSHTHRYPVQCRKCLSQHMRHPEVIEAQRKDDLRWKIRRKWECLFRRALRKLEARQVVDAERRDRLLVKYRVKALRELESV
jgi:hypothetical protein